MNWAKLRLTWWYDLWAWRLSTLACLLINWLIHLWAYNKLLCTHTCEGAPLKAASCFAASLLKLFQTFTARSLCRPKLISSSCTCSHSPLLLLLILTLSREFIGNESAKERKTRRFKMHSHSLAKFQCLSLSLPFASYKPIFKAISSWQNKFTWQTKTRNSANMYCFSNRQLTTR